jgi:hypothetical protein
LIETARGKTAWVQRYGGQHQVAAIPKSDQVRREERGQRVGEIGAILVFEALYGSGDGGLVMSGSHRGGSADLKARASVGLQSSGALAAKALMIPGRLLTRRAEGG